MFTILHSYYLFNVKKGQGLTMFDRIAHQSAGVHQ